jgi:hypothetical protein
LGLPQTIKKINRRNNILERIRWAVEGSTRPSKKKKRVISLWLNLSNERGGING